MSLCHQFDLGVSMIRWASVICAAALGSAVQAQTKDVIVEVSELGVGRAPLRLNPFGGALAIQLQPVRPAPVPLPPGGPFDPSVPRPGIPRPIRPAAPTLPATGKLDQYGDPLPAGAVTR